MNMEPEMTDQQQRMQRTGAVALKVGIGAGVLSAVVAFFSHGQFFQSYLLAYIFWLGLAGGSLGLLLLQHLVIGRWWLVIRRILEAGARTMPLMLLLFLPILFGIQELYEWAHPGAMEHDALLSQKAAYLNTPAFLVRAAIYFAAWILMTRALTTWSRRQDQADDAVALSTKMRVLSGIGLVIYGLTTTFAAFDWVMSLEPHWFSTIYGALAMIGQGLSTLALAAIVLHILAKDKPLKNIVKPQQFHDVGNLMFAFIILWAYMSFGQFLIIWSANLYEETFWYLDRSKGGWLSISYVLFLANFLIPFFLLLMKNNKRRSGVLWKIALWILLTRFVDLHWHIAPTFHEVLHVHLLDVLLPIALGGIWVWMFLKQLAGAPVVPVKDPQFAPLFGDAEDAGH